MAKISNKPKRLCKRATDLLAVIELYTEPVKFIFLQHETRYNPVELRTGLEELLSHGKIIREVTTKGIVYKAVKSKKAEGKK